mgnify:CR=1 FL=1
MSIVQWCNDNQGFVMAFLTLIYVIATVLILVSNRKSTKIMHESLMPTDKIKKENIKMALHTKRLDAFDKLNHLVIKIHEEGPKPNYIDELLRTCKTVYYLFDDSIDIRVKKIVFDIQRLRRVEYEHRNFAKNKKERASLNEHEKNLHANILDELNQLTDLVNNYLDVGEFGLEEDNQGEAMKYKKAPAAEHKEPLPKTE